MRRSPQRWGPGGRQALEKRVRFGLELSFGYDSQPFASDLGELVTPEEEPSIFWGVGLSLGRLLFRHDQWRLSARYTGQWKIFLSSETLDRGRGAASPGGGMMTTSTSAFGHTSNGLGFTLRYGEWGIRLAGISRSFDPFYADNLAGVEGSLLWTREGKYGQDVTLSVAHTAALSEVLDPFAGTAVKLLFLQELPSVGKSITMASLRGAYYALGTSDQIECDATVGCPLRIPWRFLQIGGELITTVPVGRSFWGFGLGYLYFRQLEETSIDGGYAPFDRVDHRFSAFTWFKVSKAPGWKFRFHVTHNRSNAEYPYYDLNYTRFVGCVAVDW